MFEGYQDEDKLREIHNDTVAPGEINIPIRHCKLTKCKMCGFLNGGGFLDADPVH